MRRSLSRHRLHAALLLLPLLLGACRPAGPELVRGPAIVFETEIFIMESFPVQVSVVGRGYLPDDCTRIEDVRSRFEPESDRFVVEITTVREADAVCAKGLVPFEERVGLDVYGVSAGTYTVDVNGVTDSFTLAVDNPEQAPSEALIPWDQARELILSGQVQQVTQRHSLKVTLQLKDGQRLVTLEPEIDDVFDVVEECGRRCSRMVLATE